MKEITFNELCRLVSKVDYLYPSSYPINFEVGDAEYCVGIGDFVNNTGKDIDVDIDGLTEELQYLIKFHLDDEAVILDVQDPDNMDYVGVVSMLKRHCGITDDSKIYLYEEDSFNGEQMYSVDWEECSEEVKYKALNKPCRKCNNEWWYDCNTCERIKNYIKDVKEKFAYFKNYAYLCTIKIK